VVTPRWSAASRTQTAPAANNLRRRAATRNGQSNQTTTSTARISTETARIASAHCWSIWSSRTSFVEIEASESEELRLRGCELRVIEQARGLHLSELRELSYDVVAS